MFVEGMVAAWSPLNRNSASGTGNGLKAVGDKRLPNPFQRVLLIRR